AATEAERSGAPWSETQLYALVAELRAFALRGIRNVKTKHDAEHPDTQFQYADATAPGTEYDAYHKKYIAVLNMIGERTAVRRAAEREARKRQR
ncbi:MAG: hypothetical protein RL681_259, partial [Candidatus Parcubacteria bacterium]